MAKRKTSSNNGANKYIRGFNFWNTNAFWRDPSRRFSDTAKRYYENWLEELRQNERAITRL